MIPAITTTIIVACVIGTPTFLWVATKRWMRTPRPPLPFHDPDDLGLRRPHL